MKSTRISFLFFCCTAMVVMTAVDAMAHSQRLKDSTQFYYKSITQVNDLNTLSRAFKFFENKAGKALISKDTLAAAYCIELISLGQFNLGLFYESESNAIRALKLLDAIKNDVKTLGPRKRLLNQLGMIYRKVEDYDNSNRFYAQALDLNTDVLGRISIINNTANNFGDQNRYKEAVDYLNVYYEDVLKLTDNLPKATYLDNLGYYQSKVGDSKAVSNMEFALKIKSDVKNLQGLFSSYRHLSIYFSDRKDPINAKNYAEMANTISDSLNIPEYQLEALALNLKLETNSRFHEYLELNSKIDKAKKSKENKFAAIKYDFQKSELKLKASDLETERQQKISLMYLLIGSVLLLVATLLFVYLRSRHKKEKIQQVFKTETRISKKIHDELANDMSDIMNFVENELQTSLENKTKLLDTLEDVYLRTRDISTETASVDFINFSESLKYLLIQHNKKEVKVIVNDISTIDWLKVPDHKKLAVYRCLQELMVNMKKHSKAKLVSIVFKNHKKKNEIWYTDDGQGGAIEKIRQGGLKNAEFRIKEVGGSLKFDTSEGNGFKAVIVFYN